MIRLLRRLFPARRTSLCAGCRTLITERRRRPCRACGSINRVISVGWTEAPKAASDFL